MINFIIYENNKIWQQFYIDCFLKIIKKTNKKYTVIKFKDYSTETLKQIDKLVGKKIYFLDFYLPSTTGIEIAYEIRRKNDWFSPIILFIANKNTRINYETKILRLN